VNKYQTASDGTVAPKMDYRWAPLS